VSAPFEAKPVPEQGFFGSLFGRVHRDAMLAEVETALAGAADWATVTRDEIAAIEGRYGGTLRENARSEAMMLVVRAANSLTAQAVVEGGAARLRALAAALTLSAEAETVVQARAKAALGEAALALIADDRLTDEERVAWDEAVQRCGFEGEQVNAILTDAVAKRMKDEIAAAVADGRLTDAEEARIERLGRDLRVQLDLDDATRDQLIRAKRLWQVEDGELDEANCPIALPKTETCIFAGYGQVMEPRTRGAKSFTHSYGAGDIVLTTKRLIFNGGQKNIAVQLISVVDYDLFDDGVEIRKATGKPLTFALGNKDEWFARLFVRARRDVG
jgi:hypothetical protein